MRLLPVLLILVVLGCATTQGPRISKTGPQVPASPRDEYPIPTPSWPLRQGSDSPSRFLPPRAMTSWAIPDQPELVAATPVSPGFLAIPLPELRILPLKATPASRSWTPVAQMKTVVPIAADVIPHPPSPKILKPTNADSSSQNAGTNPQAKAPATIAAAPQPASRAITSPPTAASTASLLPTDPTPAPDFRWQDINAVAGDAVTLHFDKTNWLYLDSPSQQKTLGFQSISRDKDATTFQFRPSVPGQYTLEFQRQDLANQTTDSRKVILNVVPPGTRTSTSGTALAPQISTVTPNDALESSRQLSADGKTAEAVQKLLQSYKADDTRMNLELARLLDQTGQDDQALSYLDKNLPLAGPDFQGTLELGTKLAAIRDPEKKLPTYVRLWTAGTAAPPEDLYLQVFEALRTQKLSAMANDWSKRYGLWYPAPQFKDGYLFQMGQLLEAPGEGRNIQGAWKAYDEVVQDYPLSPYWKPAGERAAYLNRHFLQVR